MKRLYVRAAALVGLTAATVFAVVQIHRAQPVALGQDSPASTTSPKKKPKAKIARKTPPPSVQADDAPPPDRYGDRYADRYNDAPASQPASSAPESAARIQADFDSQAPEPGPDLYAGRGDDEISRGEVQAHGDNPHTRRNKTLNRVSLPPTDASNSDESSDAAASAAEQTATISDPFAGQASDRDAPARKNTSLAKKPSRVARNERSSTTARPKKGRAAAVDPFGSDLPGRGGNNDRPTSGTHRDPFGDAAQAAPPRRQQGIAGQGRPGPKLLEGAQSPTLVVEKAAPEEIQVGKPAVFAIRVQNTSSAPAHDVVIHDLVPQGTQLMETHPAAQVVDGRLVWSIGTLKPNDTATVEMQVLPLAEGEIGSVAVVHSASEASVRTRCTRPQLTIDVNVPDEVLIGDDVAISIKISNPGTGIATGVVLTETIPDQLQHPSGSELEYEVGDLKPGESRQIELTMNAVKAGQVVNNLVAQGEGELRAEQQSQFMVVAPQLEVSMQGPKRRYLERQATYTVTVSNPGTAAAKEVQLITHLPKGLKFMGANNAGEYDPVTNTVHWVLEELPPKEAGQVTLTTLPVEMGEQMLKVESVAQRGLSAEQEEVVSVEGVAAILFQLVDVADPIEVGGETTYEIRVVNQGSKAATNVELVAIFPPQLKPRSANGPTRDTIHGQEVRFQPLNRLPPKGETTYQVRAQGIAPGDLRVQVQLMAGEMQSPVTKEESTRVYADE